jgi:PAS domain S-box-containing protein
MHWLPGWLNLRLRTQALILIAVPAAATVIIACASYVLGAGAASAGQRVRGSLRVQQEMQRLRTFENESSANALAYFTSGDEVFAEKARATIAGFGATRRRLDGLTEDNPVERGRLSEVEAIEGSRVAGILGAMARFQAGALTQAQLLAALRTGESERLRMESVLGAMEEEERGLLEGRLSRVDKLRSFLGATSGFCMFFGVVGGVVISLLYGAGITRRIGKLQENVARLATGGVLNPLPGGGDEIGALAEGIAKTERVLRHRTAALEHALHGIGEADASGRYVSVNKAYAGLAGLTGGALPPSVAATVNPEDQAGVEEAIRVMRASGWAETEAHIARSGGSVVAVEMTFLPVLEGPDSGYYIFLRDISLHKRAEEALVAARDAAVASNLTRTQFLAKIGHDIRTPLNAILGAADLLSQSALTGDQSEYVKMFQRNCRHLVGLINDFLDFSQIEAGALKVEKIAFQIQETVHNAATTFRELASRKGIQLGVYLEPGLPEQVLGDPLRIQQILVNLLSNALKFTERGCVDVRVLKLTDPAGDRLLFEVTDSGPGISATDQARIFKAFTQLPQQTSHPIRGSGLGLAICRELVELMGGEIGVTSLKDRGSNFHFSLPLEAADPAARPEETLFASQVATRGEPAAGNERVRLLVAEDGEDNRLLIEHYLRGAPIQVEFSEDGQQAVDAIQGGKKFDLILMDIDLPVLDGYQATRAILQWQLANGVASTPIVALSAHAMREAVRASLEAGCVAHVAKPVDRPMLLRTVYRYALPRSERVGETPAVPEEVLALIPKYLASKAGQIEEARASLSRNDFDPIRRFGHNLKGTGGGYGFPRIEALGREIEQAAQSADANSIAGQLDALFRFVTDASESLGADLHHDAPCSN